MWLENAIKHWDNSFDASNLMVDVNFKKTINYFITRKLISDSKYLISLSEQISTMTKFDELAQNKGVSKDAILQNWKLKDYIENGNWTATDANKTEAINFIMENFPNIKQDIYKLYLGTLYLKNGNKKYWHKIIKGEGNELTDVQKLISENNFVMINEAIKQKLFLKWAISLPTNDVPSFIGRDKISNIAKADEQFLLNPQLINGHLKNSDVVTLHFSPKSWFKFNNDEKSASFDVTLNNLSNNLDQTALQTKLNNLKTSDILTLKNDNIVVKSDFSELENDEFFGLKISAHRTTTNNSIISNNETIEVVARPKEGFNFANSNTVLTSRIQVNDISSDSKTIKLNATQIANAINGLDVKQLIKPDNANVWLANSTRLEKDDLKNVDIILSLQETSVINGHIANGNHIIVTAVPKNGFSFNDNTKIKKTTKVVAIPNSSTINFTTLTTNVNSNLAAQNSSIKNTIIKGINNHASLNGDLSKLETGNFNGLKMWVSLKTSLADKSSYKNKHSKFNENLLPSSFNTANSPILNMRGFEGIIAQQKIENSGNAKPGPLTYNIEDLKKITTSQGWSGYLVENKDFLKSDIGFFDKESKNVSLTKIIGLMPIFHNNHFTFETTNFVNNDYLLLRLTLAYQSNDIYSDAENYLTSSIRSDSKDNADKTDLILLDVKNEILKKFLVDEKGAKFVKED